MHFISNLRASKEEDASEDGGREKEENESTNSNNCDLEDLRLTQELVEMMRYSLHPPHALVRNFYFTQNKLQFKQKLINIRRGEKMMEHTLPCPALPFPSAPTTARAATLQRGSRSIQRTSSAGHLK